MSALLEKTSLILWDEAPMKKRFFFEALDRTLRDVLSVEKPENASLPFGGKAVVFGGDFRQVLPVVEGGSRNEIIGASLVMSPLWKDIEVLALQENMRLKSPGLSYEAREEYSAFAKWVLDLGNGDIPSYSKGSNDCDSWISIPDDIVLHPSSDNMNAVI